MHCAEYLIQMTEWGTHFGNMPIKVFVGYSSCLLRD